MAGEHLWHPDDAGDAPDTPTLISTLNQITNPTLIQEEELR